MDVVTVNNKKNVFRTVMRGDHERGWGNDQ
jgi:hypothetical protein